MVAQAWREHRGVVTTPLGAAREGGYGLPEASGDGEHYKPGVTRTVRTVTHRGRKIKIETTYKVTIDDEPLKGMLEALGDGRVYYQLCKIS
jgi:hypothetical protein